VDAAQKPRKSVWKRWSVRIPLGLLAFVVIAYQFVGPSAPPPARSSGQSMQAIRYHEYGDSSVLRLERVDRPLPNDDQVLVQVRAAGANPLDWHYMRGTPWFLRLVSSGLRRPLDPRIGVDVAGVVVAVGRDVRKFKVGDEVFGTAPGSFAEYARAREVRLAHKPANVTFEEAAAVPIAAITALQGLRDKGGIRTGQKVLVNGASGGVGTFAVQIAKAYGAEVDGVCSTRNVELVRSLGADRVYDYTQEDFTRSGTRYDLIIDTVGNRTRDELQRVMTPHGIHVGIGKAGGPEADDTLGILGGLLGDAIANLTSDQQFAGLLATVRAEDLQYLHELIAAGKVKPVIDRTYSLQETPQAIAYLERGRARGKVVVRVDHAAPVAAR
jgi:NADPH:quinone reductase-like Zn-dependent oxidoreductase